MLVVEDDAVAAMLLTAIVERMGAEVLAVTSGADAVDAVASAPFDLVLLDVGLPDVDGYDVAARLRERFPAERLPIVFVSGEQDVAARVRGFAVGGADFVTKPYDPAEVCARVEHQLEMRRLREELEHAAERLEGRVAQRTAQLSERMAELAVEIERREALEAELRHLASTDPVTGLLNQRGLAPRLAAWRSGGSARRWVVVAEVDGWESVVGLLGHRNGDLLLAQLADRIGDAFPAAPAGRLGASLFVIGLGRNEAGVDVVSRLRDALESPIRIGGRRVRVSMTVGAVEDHNPAVDAEEVLREAMLALYAAKREPGGSMVLDEGGRNAVADSLDLEQDLWGATGRGELRLLYQPLYRADTMQVGGFEALVRWDHPARGTVSPGVFIPIAERCGAIEEIGDWTLREATSRLAAWHAAGEVPGHVGVAVNISAVQAVDLGLPDRVGATLAATNLAPSSLELELTETAVLRQARLAGELLDRIRRLGVQVSLDDFGTGGSSLTLLREVPADVVKLDRSFVVGVADDAGSRDIVEATVDLSHRLGMEVVAEGIETRDQLDALVAMGCDRLQGYLLCRPLEPDAVARVAAPPQ